MESSFLQIFVLPSFCLSDRITGIHVHLLILFTAVYPVLLMATVYIAIELHARDNRVVHFLWKPFGICFANFKSNWSANDSVIHAFASSLMLSSSTKFVCLNGPAEPNTHARM